ncbi:hypothetical protein ACLB2K_053114 [Fragaria x ananassa]
MNRVKRGGPWVYQRAMIILNGYDGFSDIMYVPLDFVWIWVGIEGFQMALPTSATTRYERLVRRCRTCSMLNHGGEACPRETEEVFDLGSEVPRALVPPPIVFRGNSAQTLTVPNSPTLASLFPKEKRSMQIREVPAFPSPAKVTSVWWGREEETTLDGKHAHHMLTFAPLPLNPKELGFSMVDGGALGIKKTGKSPKKRGKGRPRGSRTKKNLQLGECSDSMEPSLGENADVVSGLESEAEEE